ncbi:MAG: ATP-dependent DNA helicase RecG, partial [Candidatus Geothermincolales bacterium]
MLRRLIARALEQFGDLPDFLPARLRLRYGMPPRIAALREIHFPTSPSRLKAARDRLAYEELFLIQVALAIRRYRLGEEEKGISHRPPGGLIAGFLEKLPFKLTPAQERAFREIVADMARPHPMNRLLQGEVGSGKTVVALLALLLTVENGHQGAFMAPTEILAEQHFRNLVTLLEDLPGVRMELLTGSTPSSRRREILQAVAGGMVDILVGTHALIQEDVEFRDLGLVVVDEQHRFGVRQRMLLKAKGTRPDTLIMTATPIPRTLSLTLYGDLEVSVIDQLPTGRPGTTTHVIGPQERERAYRLMEEEMRKGRQGYVVCPLVGESASMEVKAAENEVRELRKAFPGFEVGMVHGQMPRQEREEAMERFRRGELHLLVSTTVIEVGIDVPNATFILVEDADRFGLSQLHQLRGRVGRGEHPSHCFFLFRGDTDESLQRRKAIEEITDGFRLAEADLEIRGEGSLFGTRQSGFTDLKVARLQRDLSLLERAKEDATALVREDPGLEREDNLLLRMEMEKRFRDSLEWIFHA